MRKLFTQKIFSAISSAMLLLQAFSPYMLAVPQAINIPVYAQTTEEAQVTPTPEAESPTEESIVTAESNPEEVTPTPTTDITITPTPELTITETPTETISPTEENPQSTSEEKTEEQRAPPEEQSTESTEGQTENTEEATLVDGVVAMQIVETNQCFENSINGCDATVTTDKADYAPTEVVFITGTNFDPNTDYRLVIFSNDEPEVSFETTVTTNENGVFEVSYQLDGTYRPQYYVEVYDPAGNLVAEASFTDGQPAASIEQCRNGASGTPNNCLDLGGSAGWVNGNAGGSNSHYVEGLSIPYRTIMTDLPTGTSVELILGYDIKHSDTHAIDYLTHFDRLEPHTPFGHSAESIDPTNGVSGLSGTTTTFPIPAPSSAGSPVLGQPATSFNSLPASERLMTLYGGTITGMSYVSEGSLTASQSETQIKVIFTPDSETAVFAWGGHIASRLDWGYDSDGVPLSAGGISGSPYHMRLIDWNLNNLGNQDRSLSADAVIPPGNLTIVKDVVPDDISLWDFLVTGTSYSNNVQDIGDGGQEILSVAPGTYTITETTDPNYTTTVSCTSGESGTSSVQVAISSSESIICTFTNTLNQGELKIVKNTTGDDGTFNFTVTGPTTPTPSITTSGGTGNTGFISVDAGTYSVSETVPSGWQLDSASCADASGAPLGTFSGDTVSSIEIGPNDQVTCTFNDTRLRNITVCKFEDVNGDGIRDDGEGLLSGWEMTLTPTGAVQTTGENGCTTFTDLSPGNYTVTETLQDNWDNTTPLAVDISLTASRDETRYFGNFECAQVTGLKWEDLNGNGQKDEGEPLLENWTINLTGESSQTTQTDVNGEYSFSICVAGDHAVSEDNPDSNVWYQTYPANNEDYDLVIESGGNYTGKDFGNARYVSIGGFKYRDNDGDGVLDANDLVDTLEGWVIDLYEVVNNVAVYVTSAITDAFGEYEFLGLLAGRTYFVKEQQQPGWTQTYGPELTPTPFVVSSGDTLGIDFANFENVSVTACKIIDVDGDLETTDDQTSYSGWPVYLLVDGQTEDSQTTGRDGCYTWSDLGPGHTYGVEEGSVEGFIALNATTHSFGGAQSGEEYSHTFYNQGSGRITIIKNIDWDESGQIGDHPNDVAGATNWTWDIQNGEQDIPTGDSRTLNTGQYTISEDSQLNFHLVGWVCSNDSSGETNSISVDLAENGITCTFTNAPDRGSILGYKYEDADGDLSTTDDQTPLENWTIQLYEWINDAYSFIAEAVTNVFGFFSFTNLVPGTYEVREVISTPTPYWTALSPTGVPVVLSAGEDSEDNNFFNFENVSVTACKVEDGDGDVNTTEDQSPVFEWEVYLLEDGQTVDTQTTGRDGCYTWSDLGPGHTYGVSEETPGTWTQLGDTTYSFGPAVSGEEYSFTFYNFQNGSISGTKYNDIDGNGSRDDESGLEGWTIFIDENDNQELDGEEQSTTTNSDGNYSFTNLGPGTYVVCEVVEAGWQQTSSPQCHEVNMTSGLESDGNDFGNQGQGTVTVIKNVDTDGDGTVDGEVTEFEGLVWEWYLDADDGHDSSDTEPVTAGRYEITESGITDYHFTSLECTGDDNQYEGSTALVQVSPGEDVTCTYVNTRDTGDVLVSKYHDENANGIHDDGEDLLEGWTINLGDFSDETNSDGIVEFTVPTGLYDLSEDVQEGWIQSNISCGEEGGIDDDNNHEVNVTIDGINCAIGNYQRGRIIVTKYSDINGDGDRDEGEQTLEGWGMNLDILELISLEDTTDANGEAIFENLNPGFYDLTEDPQEGWEWISTSCDSDLELIRQDIVFNTIANFHRVRINSGDEVRCEIGNQPTIPELTIEKLNDTGGAVLTAGDDVLYTLTITASESAGMAEDVTVTDLPPDGFEYRLGSWTASSSVRGDIKGDGTTTEPTYASPGDWNLGDMIPGEVVTLTYIADIQSSQDSGIYPDLAWAQGQSVGGSQVLAQAGTDGNIGEANFVGTDVEISVASEIRELVRVEKEETREGEVLGVSLPATGAKTLWMILAGALVALGSLLVLSGIALKRGKLPSYAKKISKYITLFAFFMLFVGAFSQVHAGDLTVRVEDPASSGDREFTIDWVTLDIQGRAITVRCFKKGPSDAAYSQFDSDKAVAAGGGSGICNVSSSIVPNDGTYQFFAQAVAGIDTVDSSIVTADINTTGPKTPTAYSKNQTGCTYRLAFKTGDDSGETVKVEIYRSDSTSFVAEAATRIATIAVGSNQEVIYNDTPSDCAKAYYYAIRAFNAEGIGSGLVADSVVHVTTTTGTTTTTTTEGTTTAGGAIPVAGGAAIPAEGAEGAEVVGGEEEGGETLGEATPEATATVAPEESDLQKILGQATEGRNLALIIGILVLLGLLGYGIYRQRQS